MRTIRRLRTEPLLTKRTRILRPPALILLVKIQMRLVPERPRAIRALIRLIGLQTRGAPQTARRRRAVAAAVVPHALDRQMRVVLHQLHDVRVDLGDRRDAHAADRAREALRVLVDLDDRLERLLFDLRLAHVVLERRYLLFRVVFGDVVRVLALPVHAHVAVARVHGGEDRVALGALEAPAGGAPVAPLDLVEVELVFVGVHLFDAVADRAAGGRVRFGVGVVVGGVVRGGGGRGGAGRFRVYRGAGVVVYLGGARAGFYVDVEFV